MTDIELLIAAPWILTASCVLVAVVITRILARRSSLPRAWMVRR